jgi:putative ABC transport system permease protein
VHGTEVASSRSDAKVGSRFKVQAPDGSFVTLTVAAVVGATPYFDADFMVDRATFPQPPSTADVFVWGSGGDAAVAHAARTALGGAGSVETKSAWDTATMTSGLASQQKGIWLMLAAILILALVSLVQTTATAIRERHSEFGLLRSVGASPGQVSAAAVMESVLVLVTALVLSVAGLGVIYLKLSFYTSATKLGFQPFLPVAPLVALAAMAVIGCLATTALSLWRTTRIRPQAA